MTKHLVILALAVTMLAATPQALKAADETPLCPLGNATLRGTYMIHGTGTVVGFGPIASNGTNSFDGKGNSSNTFSASANGQIFRGITVTGTYTVNPDCTGTQILGGSSYDFVVMPDGSSFSWISVTTGDVFGGSAIRLKHE